MDSDRWHWKTAQHSLSCRTSLTNTHRISHYPAQTLLSAAQPRAIALYSSQEQPQDTGESRICDTAQCRGYGKTTGTWQRCIKTSEVEGNDNRDIREMGEMRISQSKNEKSAKIAAHRAGQTPIAHTTTPGLSFNIQRYFTAAGCPWLFPCSGM